MSDVSGEPPVPDAAAARAPLQPWSDAARQVAPSERNRRVIRRHQLRRFNEGLASMLVREEEEEETIGAILTLVVRAVWAPFMLAGGVLIHRFTGTTEYSERELAGYLALAVVIGLSIDPLWRLFKGTDQPVTTSRPDPYGPEESVAGFTRLGLQADDAGADGPDSLGDGGDGGDGGEG